MLCHLNRILPQKNCCQSTAVLFFRVQKGIPLKVLLEEYLAPSELVKMAKANHSDFLALIDGNEIVRLMGMQTSQDTAYPLILSIDENRRGKGYGS